MKLTDEHYKKLGVYPIVIGKYWQRPDLVITGILKAIESGKPYNEYELLSKSDKELFDNGELIF